MQIRLFLKAYPETAQLVEARGLLTAVLPAVPEGAAAAGEVDAATQAALAALEVTLSGPIAAGTVEIVGNSIEKLVGTGPLYSPIPGLPDEAWLGLKCTDCHQWTRAALCDQGKSYVKKAPVVALETQHPLGGAFKLNLRRWAELGCN